MTIELTPAQEAVIDDLVAILRGFLPAEEAARWFHTRHRRLDGCRPCDLVLVGRGQLAVALAVDQARTAAKARRTGVSESAGVRSGAGPAAPPADASPRCPTARTTPASADPSPEPPTEQHQPERENTP